MWTRFTFALYALPVGIWLLIEADTNARAAWCVRAPEKNGRGIACLSVFVCLFAFAYRSRVADTGTSATRPTERRGVEPSLEVIMRPGAAHSVCDSVIDECGDARGRAVLNGLATVAVVLAGACTAGVCGLYFPPARGGA